MQIGLGSSERAAFSSTLSPTFILSEGGRLVGAKDQIVRSGVVTRSPCSSRPGLILHSHPACRPPFRMTLILVRAISSQPLSEGGRLGGSEGSNRGAGSCRSKPLLFTPGLILHSHPTSRPSFRMTQSFVLAISSQPLSEGGRRSKQSVSERAL